MNQNVIYLNGFMAAGKSTIGPILANTLGWNFYDLDRIIEEELGKKIIDIFNDEGEKYFREKETETLIKLSGNSESIISLGGGTSSYGANMEILKKSGKIIYLKASPEALYLRLRNKTDRPIFNNLASSANKQEELKLKIKQLLNQREPYYNQADIIIDTDELSLGKAVDKIAKLINKKIYGEKTQH